MLNISRILLIVIFILSNYIYANNNTKSFINIDTTSNKVTINKYYKIFNIIYSKLEQVKSKKMVRILSFDGGGTRGYAQVKFLDKLCKENNIKDISMYFDLMAGTSIGALNAALLASGMQPKEIMKFFRKVSPWIFTIRSIKDIFSNNASVPSNKPNRFQKYLLIALSTPIYKAVSEKSNYGDARLRNELTKIFGDKLLTSLKIPVLFTAYNDSKYYPMIFTNLDLKGIPNTFRNIKIVDALMATMSAPIFFPSTRLHISQDEQAPAQSILDGALFQNNPSLLALITAKTLYPLAEKYSILSIGTGIGRISLHIDNDNPEPSKISILQSTRLYKIAVTNANIANDIFFKVISNIPNSNIYNYRFNFQLDKNKNCSFDTSTSDFFDYLDNKVEKQYKNDNKEIKEFIKSIKNDDSK